MKSRWMEFMSLMFFRHPKLVWRRRVITLVIFSAIVLPVLILVSLHHAPLSFMFVSVLTLSFLLAGFVIFVMRALQHGEEKFRVLVSSNPYVFWTSNENGATTFVSSTLLDICNVYPDEVYDRAESLWKERIHLHDIDAVETAYASLTQRGQSIELEYRFEKSEGNWIWIHEKRTLSAIPLPDVYLERVLSDVTRRKEAEQSAAQLASIVASSDDAIISISLGGVVESWNRGATRVFGYSSQETRGRSLWVLFPYENRDEILQVFDKVAQGNHVYQYDTQWIRKDGALTDVSLMISPILDASGKISGISTIARDISDQKKAEREIAASKQELREYLDHMSTMNAKVGLDGTILLFNKVAQVASGLTPEALFKTNFLEGAWWSYDPVVQNRVKENFKKAAQGEFIDCEEKLYVASRGVIDINLILSPIVREDGFVSYILAEGRDISALKKTQDSLVKVQYVAKLGSWEWDIVSGKVSWSETMPQLLGVTAQRRFMNYKDLLTVLPAALKTELEVVLRDCLDSDGVFSFDRQIQVNEGQLRWLHVQGTVLYDDAKKPVRIEGTIQNVTDRKKAEAQRLQLLQEQEKRDNAEQAHQRASFLAQSSLLLSSSLDYEETLRRLARLLIVSLADWCVLYLTEGNAHVVRTIVAHPDRSAEDMANHFFRRVLAEGLQDHPVMRVLASGKSEIILKNPKALTKRSEYTELSETLGAQSVMMVPLIVRGQTLGAIEFVSVNHNHAYDANDLAMAEEISYYASVAIENAQLYTETLKAKEASYALAAIVESSDDAIVGKTLEGVITSWNAGAERLYGYKAEEVIGKSISILIAQDRPNEMVEILTKLKSGQKIEHFETVRLKKDGTPLNVSLTISTIKDGTGKVVGASSISRDITERKQYEQGLAMARDAAIASDRLKSEFVANVSHEVRTPMNGIIGMTSLLLETKMSAKQRDFAETIRISCDSLLTIVNDILDFSKIEAGKMSLEVQDFDLGQLLESTGEFLAPRAHSKGLELVSIIDSDLTTSLRGDPARLRQVLTNFIGNSIKFSSKGHIAIRASAHSSTDTHVTLKLSVTDTGIGIAPARQNELFEPFSQGDASGSKKYGGTGLGLAISKRFIELMGGEIGVNSVPEKGSTFWCLVSLEKQKNPIEVSPQISEEVSRQRVLVVDENPTHRESIIQQLNKWRVKSEIAADTTDALKILEQESKLNNGYNVVIMNRSVHGEDSFALAKQIKSHKSLAGTKVVMLTMVNQPIDRNEMQALGIAVCLSKPVKAMALYEALLPIKKKSVQKSASKKTAEEKTRRAHILVVEDNGVNQKVVLQQLENLGYTADAVGNGLEAIQALEHVPYDLILMDCQMPEMDGYAATGIIRKREGQSAHTPIIAMTAHVMTGDREKCLAAGMDDYISKPIKTENLQATLARWEGFQLAKKKTELKKAEKANDDAQNPLNDPSFVREISKLFVQETPKYIKAMKEALKNKNMKALYVAAHTLAGSCCIVGTKDIKTLCRSIEAKSEENSGSGIDKLIGELEQEFEVAQKVLDVGSRRNYHENTYRR